MPAQGAGALEENPAEGNGLTTTCTVCVFVTPWAYRVYRYVTVMGSVLVLINVSSTAPSPVAAGFEIPGTAARLQLYPTCGLVLDGTYENTVPLQTGPGARVLLNVGGATPEKTVTTREM
jgi:hypothetical protein